MKIRELREGADGWEDFDEEGWDWEEVEAEKQSGEADEGREKGKEVGYDGRSSVEVDSWDWEWEEVSGSCIGGEAVPDERDGMRRVGGIGGVDKQREEVRGGEVVPDEHVRSSGEADPWDWEWEEVSGSCIGGEVVPEERDGMRFVGGLGKQREEVRGGGVGSKVIPDELGRSSGLGGKLVPYAKRTAAEVCARALFYPTLVLNIGRNVIDPDYHWCDRIDQDIFLGAVPLPGNVLLFKELGINAVVSLTKSYETLVHTSTYQAHGISHLEIPTTDYFYAPHPEKICEALRFIHENALHGGTTLVHCKAGRARSTTIVLCYLVKYKNMTPETALQHVMSIRPQVKLARSQWKAVKGFRTNISVETSSVLNSGQDFITGSDVEGPGNYAVDVCAASVELVLVCRKPIISITSCQMIENYQHLHTILLIWLTW